MTLGLKVPLDRGALPGLRGLQVPKGRPDLLGRLGLPDLRAR